MKGEWGEPSSCVVELLGLSLSSCGCGLETVTCECCLEHVLSVPLGDEFGDISLAGRSHVKRGSIPSILPEVDTEPSVHIVAMLSATL